MAKADKYQVFDVVIIGGGPAGSATAIQLLRSGVGAVLIVERGSYSGVRIGESLSPIANALLRKLGVWDDFQREQHLPVYGSCSIWGNDEPGYNDYFVNPTGFGWHLDRNRFDRFLANQAYRLGAILRTDTRFLQAHAKSDSPGYYLQLEAAGGEITQVSTRFVVDASGVQAVFARKMGVSKRILDRLICVSGFFEIPDQVSLSSMTLLEAVEYGWWYFATLPGNRVIAAMATDPEVVSEYKLSENEAWLALLSHTRLLPEQIRPYLHLREKLTVSPALSSYLSESFGENWLAVGDAASSYDPISSLGIYKSLLTGMEAGEQVVAQMKNPEHSLHLYKAFLDADFQKYQESRDYFYALEDRWPESPFWNRRKRSAQSGVNEAAMALSQD